MTDTEYAQLVFKGYEPVLEPTTLRRPSAKFRKFARFVGLLRQVTGNRGEWVILWQRRKILADTDQG